MPLRFTIRDLLWLTVVVALASAWRVDSNRKATAFARQLGGAVLATHLTDPWNSPLRQAAEWSKRHGELP